VLVYDLCHKDNLNDITEYLKEIRAFTDTAPLLLVGNKLGVAEKKYFLSNKTLKSLSKDYGVQIIGSFEVSILEEMYRTGEYMKDYFMMLKYVI